MDLVWSKVGMNIQVGGEVADDFSMNFVPIMSNWTIIYIEF